MLRCKLVALLPLRLAVALHLLLVVEVRLVVNHLPDSIGVHVVSLQNSHRLLNLLQGLQGVALGKRLEVRKEPDPVLHLAKGQLDKLVEEIRALVLVSLLFEGLCNLLQALEVDGSATHRTGGLGLLGRLGQPLLYAAKAELMAAARGHRGGSRVADGALLHGCEMDDETHRWRHAGGACAPFLCAYKGLLYFYRIEVNGRHTRERVNESGFR